MAKGGVGARGVGDFTGTPVVANGCVYIGSNAGCVFVRNFTGALQAGKNYEFYWTLHPGMTWGLLVV